MKDRAYRLMKNWCDTLLTYQVRTGTPYTDRGLLCPACHVIHGRIADLVFPFSVIWSHTGDEKYLEEADRLIRFSEYNLKSTDGLWYNDITNRWYATSTFFAISVGETLLHFEKTLPKKYSEPWKNIFLRMSNVFMTLDKRADFKPVSNYFAAMSAALAMAWRITGAEEYKEKAEYWRDRVIERIDEEGILYGEGYPMSADDGSHTIDMGYNLEESIPLMLLYASLTGDREDFFRQRMRDHLAFLLPDGGIDNSFGSRHNKWTYWGSRTSDGLIEGLCLALDDAVMAEACERVLSMYERSTHDGLLAMPMAHEAGEPTCLHHTFAHAKALAALVCADEFEKTEHTLIPCEEKWGVRKYQNGRLLLVSSGAFRATFSAVDARYLPAYAANGGGSMNLLYHEKHGVLCAATSVEYDPSEPLNQQYLRNAPNPECMTAQFEIDGRLASLEDGVKLSYKGLEVVSEGEGWRASYAFDSDRLTIRLLSEKGIYRLPIVTSKFTRPRLSEDKLTLVFESGLSVTSNRPMDVDVERRVFHQVGGLMYLPIRIPVGDEVTVTIE